MRHLGTIALTLGLVVVLAAPALGQQPKRGQGQGKGQRGQGGGFGQGGIGALLDNEGVQKELKLDADQVDKVKAAVKKVQDKHQDDRAKLRDLSQEERRGKTAELTRTISAETLTAVEEVLKPEQVKRLKQIELQQGGAQAYSRPEVQKALNLTADQKAQIQTINENAAKEMRDLFGGGNAEGAREKMAALRKESTTKINAVLTDDQKKAWKDLTGEPFEVRLGQRRRQDQ